MHIPDRTAPGPSSVDGSRPGRLRAAVLAAVAMVVVAVPLLLGVMALTLSLWFHNGGTLGGLGAAADDHYEPQTWTTALILAAWGVAALIDLAVGRATYRWALRGASLPQSRETDDPALGDGGTAGR